MNKLSIDRINQRSPYTVKQLDINTYIFKTEHNVHYSLIFDNDDLITSTDSYQLGLINVNNVKSPRDPKVRDTVIAIINDFFESNTAALLYICETGDDKQSLRNRLFMSWFEKDDACSKYAIFTADLIDEEGITNYTAIIIPIDSPDFLAVAAEFQETVKMFKDKPQQ